MFAGLREIAPVAKRLEATKDEQLLNEGVTPPIQIE